MYKFLVSLIATFIISMTCTLAAEIPIDVRINGDYLKLTEDAFIENGVTYAPLRCVSESLNVSEISWNEYEKKVTVNYNNKTLILNNNSNKAYINNVAVTMNGKMKIINNLTFIPVRFFADTLDADVSWDKTYNNVDISKDGVTLSESEKDHSFNHDDLYWMSRIITAESGGEPFSGQVAVGNVIINRIISNEFPNTLYGVVFDRNYGIQFEPVINGSIYYNPTPSCIAAAKISMRNPSKVGNCLYFFAPSKANATWIVNNRQYFTTIGNHAFYL